MAKETMAVALLVLAATPLAACGSSVEICGDGVPSEQCPQDTGASGLTSNGAGGQPAGSGGSSGDGGSDGAGASTGAGGLGSGGGGTVATPQLALGVGHSCALLPAGDIKCWGSNTHGQLGDGTKISSTVPVSALGLTDAVQLSASVWGNCALRGDGTVWCWGDDAFLEQITVPQQMAGVVDATMVAAGTHSCVLMDNIAQCWGGNSTGQLGLNTSGNSYELQYPWVPQSYQHVAVGSHHTCGAHLDGSVWCWGEGTQGQLGQGENSGIVIPVQAGIAGSALKVALQLQASCALLASGQVQCWGNNLTFAMTSSNVPLTVPIDGVIELACAGTHCAVLRQDGTVWWWGSLMQVIVPSGNVAEQPTQVQGLSNIQHVASGLAHTCAVRDDATVWCWGANLHGQLGTMAVEFSTTPLQISGL